MTVTAPGRPAAGITTFLGEAKRNGRRQDTDRRVH
jgi:hypothetical protein